MSADVNTPAAVAVTPRSVGERLAPLAGLARAVPVAIFIYYSWAASLDFSAVLELGFIWAIAAVGLALVLGSAGQMMLCQATFMLLGAYAYGWLAGYEGVPTIVALVAAGVAGGLGAVVLSPVLRLRGYTFALGTIAAALLVTQIFTTGGSWLPGGSLGMTAVPPINLGFITLETNKQDIAACCVLLAVAIFALHRNFGVGHRARTIQFIHHDEDLLAFMGGNAIRLKRILFFVAAVMGGVAGAFYAGAFGFVRPSAFGLFEGFALALVVVLGGNGRMLGAVLGALIYQMSFTILGDEHADYRFALLGAIVIAMIHFFPNGLLPAREEFVGLFPFLAPRPPRAAEAPPPAPDVAPLGLEFHGLTKRFGALAAVDDVTAVITPGALVALVGPNGAGKSTLLDLIAGAPTTDGDLVLDGAPGNGLETRRRAQLGIARTFQRVRLIPGLTVLENVLSGADHWAASQPGRVSEAERAALAREAIADVGLTGREDESVDALSFGDLRLVELARVVAARPRLVLLDEPSSGLNDAEVAAFADFIRRLHDRGCTVILVEHNLPLVQELAHEVMAMDRGRLIAHGPTAEVFALAAFRESYVGAAA